MRLLTTLTAASVLSLAAATGALACSGHKNHVTAQSAMPPAAEQQAAAQPAEAATPATTQAAAPAPAPAGTEVASVPPSAPLKAN